MQWCAKLDKFIAKNAVDTRADLTLEECVRRQSLRAKLKLEELAKQINKQKWEDHRKENENGQ